MLSSSPCLRRGRCTEQSGVAPSTMLPHLLQHYSEARFEQGISAGNEASCYRAGQGQQASCIHESTSPSQDVRFGVDELVLVSHEVSLDVAK
ncbi:hypothetical protein V6N13_064363 [Hibiscus sabdariffa]